RTVERIKRQKSQARRGANVWPQVQPESRVPISQFCGSRLASAPTASPFQQSGQGKA
ncbi:5'-3' exoribonuclease, partial [Trifolium medium]|nr:5'-3' exoribonuclease [Trifolium medium]